MSEGGDSARSRPIEPGGGGGHRVFGGCLLGCGLLVLLAGAGLLGLWLWFSGSGDQRPSDTVISEESLGTVRFSPEADDPGVVELRHRLRDEIESELGDFPGPVRSGAAALLDGFVPRELTITYEPVAGEEEPVEVMAFNPSGYTRALRFLIEETNEGASVSTYRGVEILERDDGTLWAFVGGTVVTAKHRRALEAAIDRLLDGEAGADAAAVLSPPPGSWDLTGSYPSGAAAARALRAEAGGEPGVGELADALAGAGPVAFGVDLEGGDRASGRLSIEAGSGTEAERIATALRRAIAAQRDRAAAEGASIEATVDSTGRRVEADLSVTGIAGQLDRLP